MGADAATRTSLTDDCLCLRCVLLLLRSAAAAVCRGCCGAALLWIRTKTGVDGAYDYWFGDWLCLLGSAAAAALLLLSRCATRHGSTQKR